jgi:hypothetical protein
MTRTAYDWDVCSGIAQPPPPPPGPAPAEPVLDQARPAADRVAAK